MSMLAIMLVSRFSASSTFVEPQPQPVDIQTDNQSGDVGGGNNLNIRSIFFLALFSHQLESVNLLGHEVVTGICYNFLSRSFDH
jgi:hypothetical protein